MRSTYHKYVDESRISGNGRTNKCAYFDEMDEIFGYRPGVNPLATHSTPLTQATGETMDSSSSSSSPSSNEVPAKKKRKYVSSSTTTTKSILDFFKTSEEKREARESKKMEMAAKIHEEKMGILRELVGLLREGN